MANDFQVLSENLEEMQLPGAEAYRDLADYIIDRVNVTGYLNAEIKEEDNYTNASCVDCIHQRN